MLNCVALHSHFMVNNIFEGLIWFWVPVSLVICNDIMAYVCGWLGMPLSQPLKDTERLTHAETGMLFGRTQLIQLSPKKTVEGFVGALFCTVIFGYFVSSFYILLFFLFFAKC